MPSRIPAMLVLAILIATLATSPAEATRNYIVHQDGTREIVDSIRYQSRTREYIVVSDGATFPIHETRVRDIYVVKPEQWDQGETALRAERYDDAISIFRSIVSNYERLRWDNRARLFLAQAYAGKGEHARAISTYDELFTAVTPTLGIQRAYWESMLADKRYSALRNLLDEVIQEADDTTTAMAYLMRGRTHAAEGNTTEALFDFLRTHILFDNVNSPQMHAEALYRAAGRLDALRHPQAGELRKRLRAKYPDTSFARAARQP